MTKKNDSVIGQLLRASTVGIHLVAATFVGLFMGVILDTLFGTKPWLTVIFFILGLITGFRDLFRMINKVEDDMSHMKKQDAPEPLPYDDEDEEDGR